MDNGIVGLVNQLKKSIHDDKELEKIRKEIREFEENIFVTNLVFKISKVIKENTPRN